MSKTAIQSMSTLEDTNATFHACMPIATLHKPDFVFMFQTSFGTVATLRQDNMHHAQVVSDLFIIFRGETAIRTGLLRGLVEGFEMGFQAGFPLFLITRVALQDAVVAHQPAFHSPALACGASVIEPDLVPILYWTRVFTAPDNVRMLFEQAHNLVGRWHLFALQDAPGSLVNDLLGAGEKCFQSLAQAFGFFLSAPGE